MVPKQAFPSFNNALLTDIKGLTISTKSGFKILKKTFINEMEWKSDSYLMAGVLIIEKSKVYSFSQLWKKHIASMLREQKSANEQMALLSLWCKEPTRVSIVRTQGSWSRVLNIHQSLFQNTGFEQISLPSSNNLCLNANFSPSQKISVWTMLTDGSDYLEGT